METYLDRIKLLKNERKMTNDQLAERSGIPLGTLSKVLAGMSDSPKLSTIVALCSALDCSVEYIVSGAEENTNNYTLSVEEIHMMEQFRTLDFFGKDLVKTVISKEAERVAIEPERIAAPAPASKQEGARVLRPINPVGRYVGERVKTEKRSILLYELPVSAGVGVYLDEAVLVKNRVHGG